MTSASLGRQTLCPSGAEGPLTGTEDWVLVISAVPERSRGSVRRNRPTPFSQPRRDGMSLAKNESPMPQKAP